MCACVYREIQFKLFNPKTKNYSNGIGIRPGVAGLVAGESCTTEAVSVCENDRLFRIVSVRHVCHLLYQSAV